tara:strand:+ start:958 stop:1791 length:834 start_codon:yes stop_codon:yes gene_type:complete
MLVWVVVAQADVYWAQESKIYHLTQDDKNAQLAMSFPGVFIESFIADEENQKFIISTDAAIYVVDMVGQELAKVVFQAPRITAMTVDPEHQLIYVCAKSAQHTTEYRLYRFAYDGGEPEVLGDEYFLNGHPLIFHSPVTKLQYNAENGHLWFADSSMGTLLTRVKVSPQLNDTGIFNVITVVDTRDFQVLDFDIDTQNGVIFMLTDRGIKSCYVDGSRLENFAPGAYGSIGADSKRRVVYANNLQTGLVEAIDYRGWMEEMSSFQVSPFGVTAIHAD